MADFSHSGTCSSGSKRQILSNRLFLDWETGRHKVPSDYDAAILGLATILSPHSIIGWHCTKLTEAEIANIRSSGMLLLSTIMLEEKLSAVVQAGYLSMQVASII